MERERVTGAKGNGERERVTGAKGNGERESDRSQRKWRERE